MVDAMVTDHGLSVRQACRAARLARSEVANPATGHPLRAAFAGNLLPGRVPGLCRPLRIHRSVQPPAHAYHRQRIGHRHYGGRSSVGFVV